jgi:hypothetical protein
MPAPGGGPAILDATSGALRVAAGKADKRTADRVKNSASYQPA